MPPSRRGTGFTNLQTYLGLNQGAAQQMGNAIASPVEQAGQKVAGDIQTAEANTLEGIKGATLQGPGSGTTAADAAANAGKTYNGPMGIEAGTFSDLAGRAASVQTQANALGNNTGRATLLGQKYGQNSWGGGQLDAALAGAGGAGGRLSGAAGAYGRLVRQLGGAQANTQQAARSAADATGKAAEAYGAAAPRLAQLETQRANTHQRAPTAPRPQRPNRVEDRRRNPDNDFYP